MDIPLVSLPFTFQTYREPVSDYQVLREKAASQRRDVERALTRFMAKTGETQSLFKDDVSTFPCKSLSPSGDPVLSFEIIIPSFLSLSMIGKNESSVFVLGAAWSSHFWLLFPRLKGLSLTGD